MKEFVIDLVSDDTVEISVPDRRKRGFSGAAVCVCCQRADQPMDDDGCGICDVCLGLPVRATDGPDGLEFPDASSHLSFTARHR